jgi:hypothetical protein
LCAHRGQRVGELDVALDAPPASPDDPHRATAEGAGGKKVAGGRRIALDDDASGRDVALAWLHDEAAPAVTLDHHAEALHEVEGDLDVGTADQLALDIDGERLVRAPPAAQPAAGR